MFRKETEREAWAYWRWRILRARVPPAAGALTFRVDDLELDEAAADAASKATASVTLRIGDAEPKTGRLVTVPSASESQVTAPRIRPEPEAR